MTETNARDQLAELINDSRDGADLYRWNFLDAADAILAAGWRPPLPEVMYDAGETAEEAVHRLAAEVVGLRQELSSLHDAEAEWGVRPIGEDEVEETGTEEWARAVAARMPTLYVAVSRRPAGPWVEVPRG